MLELVDLRALLRPLAVGPRSVEPTGNVYGRQAHDVGTDLPNIMPGTTQRVATGQLVRSAGSFHAQALSATTCDQRSTQDAGGLKQAIAWANPSAQRSEIHQHIIGMEPKP